MSVTRHWSFFEHLCHVGVVAIEAPDPGVQVVVNDLRDAQERNPKRQLRAVEGRHDPSVSTFGWARHACSLSQMLPAALPARGRIGRRSRSTNIDSLRSARTRRGSGAGAQLLLFPAVPAVQRDHGYSRGAAAAQRRLVVANFIAAGPHEQAGGGGSTVDGPIAAAAGGLSPALAQAGGHGDVVDRTADDRLTAS